MSEIIRREDVIKGLNQLVAGKGVTEPDDEINVDDAIAMVMKLPTGKVQKKEALWHWVPYQKPSGIIMYVQCDHCLKTNKIYCTDYCPHCGYKMANKELIKNQRRCQE